MRARRALFPLAAMAIAAPMMASTAAPAVAGEGPSRWSCLSHYESTHRWHIKTGNGYFGGLQFSASTWRYYGGLATTGHRWPHRASRAEQIMIAKRTAYRGWRGRPAQGGRSAWPNNWSTCR